MSPSEQAKLPLLPEARDDSLFIDAAAQRYKEAPLEAFGTWFARYPYLWIGTRTAFVRPAPKTGGWFAYKASMWLLNLGMLLLGCAGGLIAMRRRDRDRVLLVPIAYVALIYLPFHSTEPRYSLVALPFLLALAVYAALQITGARQQT